MGNFRIRDIEKQDNEPLNKIIKEILLELNCTTSEYLSEAAELQDLYEQYSAPKSHYWVVEDSAAGEILGGGGYSEIEEGICELQKMYLLKEARGHGLAKILFDKICDEAKENGFKKIYLETMTEMKSAIGFYEKKGFKYIEKPLGNTGHNCCSVFMIREINDDISVKLAKTQEDLDYCFKIREMVFINEQNVPIELVKDKYDETAKQFLLIYNEKPVATARMLKKNSKTGKIGKVAVLKEYRGKNFGKIIMEKILDHCRNSGITEIMLDAQTHVIPFYNKLGFKQYGEEFMDAGIPHYKMEMSLN